MMFCKLIIYFFSFIIYINLSYSQQGWYWVNPLPQANNLNRVSFVDMNSGYAVGDGGVILKTTNGGNNWNVMQFKSYINLRFVKFINYYNGFVITSDNKLFKTNDAGLNWDSTANLIVKNGKVSFRDENTGILFGDTNVIYKTTNGGNIWQYSTNAPVQSSIMTDVYFVNDSSIKCIGNYTVSFPPYYSYNVGYFMNTLNAGNNWSYSTVPDVSTNSLKSLYFINNNTGFIAGGGSCLKKTTNGGLNWNTISFGFYCYFQKILFFNSIVGYLYGTYSSTNSSWFLSTSNAGNTWTSNENVVNLSDFQPLNENITCAVGSAGDILISSNSGQNWFNKKTSVTSNRLNCLFAISENTIITAGNGGIIMKSTDSGKSWQQKQSGITNFIVAINFTDSLFGAAVSPLYIIQTTTGGESWNIRYNSQHYLEDIYFLDNNTGFACGRNKYFLKTNNGGLNWNISNIDTISNFTINYKKIFFINQLTGYILGNYPSVNSSNTIYKTTNRGENWIGYSGPTEENDLFFIDENTGISTGYFGSIHLTTNAGQNWFTHSYPTNSVLNSITFINNITGYIVGYAPHVLLKTTNSGINWISEPTGLPYDWGSGLYGITSINGYAMFVGDFGIIKSTNPLANVFVKNNNHIYPSVINLFQNYPNPFNSNTKIIFELPYDCDVTLIVYDIIGKEVKKLINSEFKHTGRYIIDFKGDNLSSGIYFYRLKTEKYTETKSMILLK